MRFVLTPHALSRTRFAVSPLAELVGVLTTLCAVLEEPAALRRRSATDAEISALRRWRGHNPVRHGLTALLGRTSWLPDYTGIAPPPRGTPSLQDELAQIAAWDAEAFRSTTRDAARAARTPQDLAWLETPALPEAVAQALDSAWTRLVLPTWAWRRQVLDREIAFRTTLVGADGWAGAIAGVARDIEWIPPDTVLVSRRTESVITVADHLSFVPTTQRRGRWTCDGPDGVAVVYGARGARARSSPGGGGALGRLLGSSRAAVLLALDLPATPTHLHRDLGLALGTIGGHLSVLEAAGLVVRNRAGREVLYRRTPLGEDLVDPRA